MDILLAAFYLHDLSPFLWEFSPGIGLRWYGLAYILAFIAGFWIYRDLSRRGWADLPRSQVADFITWWVVLGTLIGGRLGYILFYQPDILWEDPLGILRVWEGGMSAHGGMLGLIIATWLYARTHGISWWNLGDNLVVAAPIGLFCGRMANFINGELYGRVTDVPWAVQFPKELYTEPGLLSVLWQQASEWRGAPAVQVVESVRQSPELREILVTILNPRHPSQIYEALLEGVVLFVILWLLRTRVLLPNGVLTGVFFIGYAVFRGTVEFFREPDAGLVFELTRGQFLSLGLLLVGVVFIFVAYLRPSYPLAKAPSPSKKNSRPEGRPKKSPPADDGADAVGDGPEESDVPSILPTPGSPHRSSGPSPARKKGRRF